jgi:WD40 repeat protein
MDTVAQRCGGTRESLQKDRVWTGVPERAAHTAEWFARQPWLNRFAAAVTLAAGISGAGTAHAQESTRKPLPVVRPSRTDALEFYRDILPLLRENCLPCHNRTTTKADLLLETPADLLKGGESGTALVPGKSAESLVFKVSAHLEKPRMPPKDNKVNAVNLTPEQLGLLALWIDQGAKAGERVAEVIQWQALPDRVDPILAVAVPANGRYAACSRGNQIEVYRMADGAVLSRPVDPALGVTNGAAPTASRIAHRDVVNALAFSPDGEWLASGGFREVKLWRRTWTRLTEPTSKTVSGETGSVDATGRGVSADGNIALALVNGQALLSDAESRRWITALRTDLSDLDLRAGVRRDLARVEALQGRLKSQGEAAGKELDAQRERVRKSSEALTNAQAAVAAKEPALPAARQAQTEAELQVLRLKNRRGKAAPSEAETKAAADKLAAAVKEVGRLDGELKPLAQRLDSARNERELAVGSMDRAALAVSSAEVRGRQAATEREGIKRRLAEAEVRCLAGLPRVVAGALSPDSRRVVTAHEDGVARIWDAADGAPLDRVSVEGAGVVKRLAFASTDTLVVEGTAASFRIPLHPEWLPAGSLGTDGRTNAPAFADRINALAFRPDGQRLAVGGGEPTRGGDLSLWDPATGRLIFTLPALHSDSILSLAWSPDGRALLSGGADRFGRVVDTGAGRQVKALEGHTGHVLGVAWSPDGSTLATAGADMVVKLWDATTGEKRKQAVGFGHEATSLAFLGSPGRLVIGSGDGELRVVDDSGSTVSGFEGSNDFVYGLGASADAEWIVAGGQDRTLRFWRNGTKAAARTLAR